MRLRLAILAALIATPGCGDDPPINYPTEPPEIESDTRLGPGDVIEIRVFQQEDMTAPYTVSSQGTITFPLIGAVTVNDKTPAQLETEIRARLADGYLRDPQVSVLIKEANSRKIDVFGQVRRPGSLAFRDGMTITEAISSAGGFTGMAKRNSVRVTRRDDDEREDKYVLPVENIGEGSAPNFYLRPGDVIYVPERLF
jgi:polysaccharide export outer membrane protein